VFVVLPGLILVAKRKFRVSSTSGFIGDLTESPELKHKHRDMLNPLEPTALHPRLFIMDCLTKIVVAVAGVVTAWLRWRKPPASKE
jgi:hypothetical protein